VLPFSVTLRPGQSIHEQIVYAVKKALVSGRLKPGDGFPSVRALSKDLRVNPNTAHKVVATLVGEGLLEVKPGIGTVVAKVPAPSPEQRRALLKEDAERLVVEARRLALDRGDVVDAVVDHWEKLDRRRSS
jgi:GntR family transcriptional regulator